MLFNQKGHVLFVVKCIFKVCVNVLSMCYVCPMFVNLTFTFMESIKPMITI